MPLIQSKSKKAFKENMEKEMSAGKSPSQSLAIAYSVKRKPKKMANGGKVAESAKTESRPMPDDSHNDSQDVSQNSGKKALKTSTWTENPMVPKPKTQPIKHPKMVPTNAFSVRLRDQEDDLESSQSPANPESQPSQAYNENGPDRKGPSVPSMKMKRMAEGGEINNKFSSHQAEEDGDEHPSDLESDNDQEKPSDDEIMEDQAEMLADGGAVKPAPLDPNKVKDFTKGFNGGVNWAEGGEIGQDELADEHHDSVASAIMSKRNRLHAMIDSGAMDEDHAAEYAEGGEVDLSLSSKEQPNEYYPRNENHVLKENFAEEAPDLAQPSDSNEDSESIDRDKHDMVNAIRRKLKQRQF